MNVIDLLKSDHEKVNGLFKSFESARKSDSGGEKQHVVEQICQELDVHAAVEEELFYPAVEKRGRDDEKAESSVREAYEEHTIVKTLVSELKGASAREDGQFDAKVKVLKDLVQHHVDEEEGTLMPRAKKLLSSEELDELGTQVENRKQELLAESPKGQEQAQPRSRRSSSSRSSSSHSSSSGSRSSSAPSRRRSTTSASSRSARSSGAPRGSRGRRSSQKGRSR